jgi:glycosyltransferase involved in cell wall biosynthesis
MTSRPRRPPRAITVVTSCFNARDRLLETAESVLMQRAVLAGRVALDYIIVDGASQDGTADLLPALAARGATVICERDRGLYDGLAKGLRRAKGEVVGWLNAGDVLHPAAFDALDAAFAFPDVHWVTGCHIVAIEGGPIVTASPPWMYRRGALRAGLHDGRILPFLQQEATYWRRSLMDGLDWDAFTSYRLGGDGWLWARFAERADLVSLHAVIAEFRIHHGQLSSDMKRYLAELRTACPARTSVSGIIHRLLAPADRAMWALGQGAKKAFNRRSIRFDTVSGRWLRSGRPAPIP